MNRIVYGTLEFNHSNLIEGACNLQHAMNGESLAIDSLTFKAWTGQEPQGFILSDDKQLKTSDGFIIQVLTDNIDPTVLTIGTPLMYYFDNVLIGRFYIDEIIRNGNDTYTFRCISSIGVLERTSHYGGIYTGQTVKDVLTDLLTGIDYELDDSVEDLRLYGYLPYDTRRNNLQQITIATGLAVRTIPNGKLLITALSKDKMSTIGNGKAIIGGSYNRLVPATNLILIEHKYETTTEVVTLFNEGLNGSTTVIFKEPIHDLVITGGTITASGANYATISGTGTVTLTGKKYLHTTKELIYGSGNGTNKVRVDNATLVTMINSEDVIKRLYDVYALGKMIEQDIIYDTERTGDMVSVINPYTKEINDACVKSLDITFGGFLKAKGKFLVDFVPSQPTMGYSNRVVLKSGTTWQVPAGVTKVRVILIGGGSGGNGGDDGVNGTPGVKNEDDGGKGGIGGNGGTGGQGGKVLNTTLSVTPGQNISYNIGLGGDGGIAESLGANGEATTFSSLSSANGTNNNEYVDIFTGDRYARIGFSGVKGGKGSGGDGIGDTINGYIPGENGIIVFSQKNGYVGQGGFGGGASNVSDGFNGEDGSATSARADGGDGGNGANGGQGENATVYGSGGQGGAGGGGGGGGGGVAAQDNFFTVGAGGLGGLGGQGGKGANGCIIIYY